MPYFIDNRAWLKLEEQTSPNVGLRRGQVGALHALVGHFAARDDPALVSLPTGYGKTAVFTAAGFLLKARRILLLVPTSALRKQALRAFATLETLRRLAALPPEAQLRGPVTKAITSHVGNPDEWNSLASADVVICIPQSASPLVEGNVPPPEGFFDLVLIDEGHHSPAETWAAFIRAMPDARHVLLTATPYRRDAKQLPGRLVFNYPLRKAASEDAFGRVLFLPVVTTPLALPEQRDDSLIAMARQILERDRAAGYDHRVFARTSTISAAKALAVKYVAAGLRFEVVSSQRTAKQIAAIEKRLSDGELDGIVCVDMFGEGYDFPRFKIAVLHEPHRSLVPTLQFIGRFARTTHSRTGDATFIAIPEAVNSESSDLYKAGVDWDVLLANVTDARHSLAELERETLESLPTTAQPSAEYEEVKPGYFRLAQHIAMYRSDAVPNFRTVPTRLKSLNITNSWAADDGFSCLLLAKAIERPTWYTQTHIRDSRHECFFIRYFPDTKLLFISASERTAGMYAELLTFYVGGRASQLSYASVRKVLHGMTDQEFYNIGIRNMTPGANAETYRIITGSTADRGIRAVDAVTHSPGHFMGRGLVGGVPQAIGASARGRVWAMERLTIAETLAWMNALHARITVESARIGPSGLDLLTVGETLTSIPQTTALTDWSRDTYKEPPTAIVGQGSDRAGWFLLDFDVTVLGVEANGESMLLQIGPPGQTVKIRYRLNSIPQFVVEEEIVPIRLSLRGAEVSLAEWLEEHPLRFFTKELDSFEGTTLQRLDRHIEVPPGAMQSRIWNGYNILVEFDADPKARTVQSAVGDALMADPEVEFVVYDHRSGEAADFVAGSRLPDGKLLVRLYHCKASGGMPTSDRLNDVYELACQSIKSCRFSRREELLSHLRRRTEPMRGRGYSPVLRGERDTVLATIEQCPPCDLVLEIIAVQPGVRSDYVARDVGSVMAAANDIVNSQNLNLVWLVSPPP